ncbi:hypothetical protein [Streptomyces sp. NPDC003036]|uniref:hypothetical protein n=1 Tax=Streptomyces sp. NPDC003036 TaxID=3154442 RepID=UPI0033B2A045
MRSTRAAAVALAGGATLLALTAAPATAVTTGPKPPARSVDCGQASNGLQVIAVTTKGSTACGTAHRVAEAWLGADQQDGRKAVVVHVDGARWKCREKQGHPNPSTECVKLKDRAEKVQLFS